MRLERDVTRQTGTEAQVGLLDVRPGRKRIHFPARDAGNCHGKLNCTLLPFVPATVSVSPALWRILKSGAVSLSQLHLRFIPFRFLSWILYHDTHLHLSRVSLICKYTAAVAFLLKQDKREQHDKKSSCCRKKLQSLVRNFFCQY